MFQLVSTETPADPAALPLMLTLVGIIVALWFRKKRHKTAVPPPDPEQATAPGSAGQVKLHDVDPKTAAILMAIVAYEMGKPLNELRFLSIRELPSDADAEE